MCAPEASVQILNLNERYSTCRRVDEKSSRTSIDMVVSSDEETGKERKKKKMKGYEKSNKYAPISPSSKRVSAPGVDMGESAYYRIAFLSLFLSSLA